MVREYLNNFSQNKKSTRSEHYQLSGDVSLRTSENAGKLRHSIELHCKGNPFKEKTPLKSVVSSALIPDDAKEDILQFKHKGQVRFDNFVKERILATSEISLWHPMKKLKLRTFSNWMEKTKVRLGDKVVKLREERELLGRCLIIQGSRPDLVPKLDYTIGSYEMSVVQRPLWL